MAARASIHLRAGRVVGRGATEVREPGQFRQAKIQLTNLDAFAGVAPLKTTSWPNSDRHLEGTWSAEGNPESSQEWTSADTTLRLEYEGTGRLLDPYFHAVSFSPVLVVKDDPANLDGWISRWVEPLRRIVSLATGRQEELTYLALTPDMGLPYASDVRSAQVFGAGITQQPFAASGEQIRQVRPAVRVAADEVDLLAVVTRWQELQEARHPLMETYGSFTAAQPQHPRSTFLLLIQSLEGLYGHDTKEVREQALAEHGSRREEVLKRALEGLGSSSDRRFLKTHLSKKPPVSLEQSLRALFSALPVDLNEELAALPLITDRLAENKGLQGPYDALSVVRNDLAHGNRSYAADELAGARDVLERVVRAHLLRLLGLPDKVVQRALRDGES